MPACCACVVYIVRQCVGYVGVCVCVFMYCLCFASVVCVSEPRQYDTTKCIQVSYLVSLVSWFSYLF
jgi:hypothetical protein